MKAKKVKANLRFHLETSDKTNTIGGNRAPDDETGGQ